MLACLYLSHTVFRTYDMSGSAVYRKHKDKRKSWEMVARREHGEDVLGEADIQNKGKGQYRTGH